MKKIILSGLLVFLTTGAIAQQSLNSNINTPELSTKYVKSANWQGKEYKLSEKEIKENNQYETTISFYRDNKVVANITGRELANFPLSAAMIKNKDINGDALNYYVSYLIIPFDDYNDGVLIKNAISIQKTNEKEDATVLLDDVSTSLIPLGREVILNRWGSEELRVLVNKK